MNYIDIPEDGNPTFTDPITLKTYNCHVYQSHIEPGYKMLQVFGYGENIPNGFIWPYYLIGLNDRNMIHAYLNANNIKFVEDMPNFICHVFVSDLSKVINCVNSVLNKLYSPNASSFHLHGTRWDHEPRENESKSKLQIHFED